MLARVLPYFDITYSLSTIFAYIIATFTAAFILFLFVYRVSSSFWSKQPMLRPWSIKPIFNSSYIIQNKLTPVINKHVNVSLLISVVAATELEHEKNAIIDFLESNIKPIDTSESNPSYANIWYFLQGGKIPSYIGLYKESYTNEIISCITSYPSDVKYLDHPIFTSHYISNLCTRLSDRKTKITDQLMGTFQYRLLQKHPKIITGVFKTHSALPYITPIAKYMTYGYDINSVLFLNKHTISQSRSITQRNKLLTHKNINEIRSLIKDAAAASDYAVTPSITTLASLIHHKVYFIFKDVRKAKTFYVFQESSFKYYDKSSIELIASFNGDIHGTIDAIIQLQRMVNAKYIMISNVSNNNCFLNILRNNKKHFYEKQTFCYMYNYAIRPLNSNKCFII